ncbi:Uncharacterised protein [Burkholderia pseudomallei]|nr:Uncharacterised protein [Burkholderia pseudomallei]
MLADLRFEGTLRPTILFSDLFLSIVVCLQNSMHFIRIWH